MISVLSRIETCIRSNTEDRLLRLDPRSVKERALSMSW